MIAESITYLKDERPFFLHSPGDDPCPVHSVRIVRETRLTMQFSLSIIFVPQV